MKIYECKFIDFLIKISMDNFSKSCVLLFLALNSQYSDCFNFMGRLPAKVRCQSYVRLEDESLTTKKGVFCRILLTALCNPLSHTQGDTELSMVWFIGLCSQETNNISTISGVGRQIRQIMFRSGFTIKKALDNGQFRRL